MGPPGSCQSSPHCTAPVLGGRGRQRPRSCSEPGEFGIHAVRAAFKSQRGVCTEPRPHPQQKQRDLVRTGGFYRCGHRPCHIQTPHGLTPKLWQILPRHRRQRQQRGQQRAAARPRGSLSAARKVGKRENKHQELFPTLIPRFPPLFAQLGWIKLNLRSFSRRRVITDL